MAFQSVWYFTDIPKEVVDIMERDFCENFEDRMTDSKVQGDLLNLEKRKSKNAWVSTNHWASGFIWHYIQRANRENFLYDLKCIDGESMQYTKYNVGEFYTWHSDAGIVEYYRPNTNTSGSIDSQSEIYQKNFVNENIELIRKLSFVLQLSDPDDYEGGNLQLLDEEGRSYIAPRKKGSIILFDSRTKHRVLKVTKGVRKSLVGWVVGPRWK